MELPKQEWEDMVKKLDQIHKGLDIKIENRMLTKVMSVLQVIVVTPIWYYLLYRILIAVDASQLMMFLFWVYTPVHVIVSSIRSIVVK